MLRKPLSRQLRPSYFLLPISYFLLLAPAPLHAQDSTQLLQQFTTLLQQMQTAQDPCPYMARMKSLVQQMVASNPDVYQAMKPSVDAMLQEDDGCSTTSSASAPAPAADTSAGGPQSMASQFTGQPGVTHTCVDNKDGVTASCMYYKNGVGIGSELACPTSGSITLGTGGPGHLNSHQTYPCVPGTPASQILAGGSGGAQICPASGFIMVQNGDVALGQQCTPGQPVNSGGSGGNGSGGGNSSARTFNYNLLTSGDCVLERGQLTFNPDGSGQWSAYIHTNHTTNRDIWHVSFNVLDAAGHQLFPLFVGDSPNMYGSPSPTIPWSVLFNFNAAQFRSIATIQISTSC